MSPAHRRLLAQINRLSLDSELKSVFIEGLMRLSPKDAAVVARDLKSALNRLSTALNILNKLPLPEGKPDNHC